MVNQIIKIDVSRLNFPTATVHARVGHSVGLLLVGAPSDVTGLYVRVFKADGTYFDIAANEHPHGAWTVYVIGTCFPAVGNTHYEIHATDAMGNPTALGSGGLSIDEFSTSSTPVNPGATITVAQIPAVDGSMVQIQMVKDSEGEWVYKAVTA